MPDVISRAFGQLVRHGELTKCIRFLEEGLRAIRKTPYHNVLGRDFLHERKSAADYLIGFHQKAGAEIDVAAIYFEMNGFTINPDLWYFDGFAYKTAGDVWEMEWLAHWDTATGERCFALTGMEAVQKAFATHYCDQRQSLSLKLAAELADHLVNARFMQLIAAAHATAKRKYKPLAGLPMLATAHDWDMVHRTQ